MNRYMRIGAGILLCVLALAGCGQAGLPDVTDRDVLAVDGKGEITFYLVRDFGKEYYDLSGLASMAMEEAAEYNTSHAQGNSIPVAVQKVEALEDGSSRVRITYQYDSMDTFNEYNGSYKDGTLFYGTVEEAVAAGYGQAEPVVSVKDGSFYNALANQEQTGKHIIITDKKAVIYCPYEVAYLSEGAALRSDGSVEASEVEGSVIILMKK